MDAYPDAEVVYIRLGNEEDIEDVLESFHNSDAELDDFNRAESFSPSP